MLLISALVAGCAKSHWAHPTKSQSELDNDAATCRSVSGLSSARGGAELGDAAQKQDQCLIGKGWRRMP